MSFQYLKHLFFPFVPETQTNPGPCFYGCNSCCRSYFNYKQTFQFSCFCASFLVLRLILGFSFFSLWSYARKILKGKANLGCLLIFNFAVLRKKYQKHQKPLLQCKWQSMTAETYMTQTYFQGYIYVYAYVCVFLMSSVAYTSAGENFKTER